MNAAELWASSVATQQRRCPVYGEQSGDKRNALYESDVPRIKLIKSNGERGTKFE